MNKVDNQDLSEAEKNPYIVNKIQLNSVFGPYVMHVTSIGTTVKVNGITYKNYIKYSENSIQKGYRLDISDAKGSVNLGNVVTIPGSEYTYYKINKIVTPELDKTTGKYTSFKNINDSPIELDNTQNVRGYQFDISINISDI